MKVLEFIQEQRKAISEEQAIDLEAGNVDDKQLLAQGNLLTGMKITKIETGIGSNTNLTFQSGIGKEFKDLNFRRGEQVEISIHQSQSQYPSTKLKNSDAKQLEFHCDGVVMKLTDKFILVSIKHENQDFPESLLKIRKLGNSISYKRIFNALNWFENEFNLFENNSSSVISLLFPQTNVTNPPGNNTDTSNVTNPPGNNTDTSNNSIQIDPSLNSDQKHSVFAALKGLTAHEGLREEEESLSQNTPASLGPTLHLIHGPPGTGKTQTLAEITRHLLSVKKRVLITAPSNIAVDNLLERISMTTNSPHSILRIGNPARILPPITRWSLETLIKSSDDHLIITEAKAELDAVLARILKTKTRVDRQNLYTDAKHVRSQIRIREARIIRSIVAAAKVVGCTLNSTASSVLHQERFDVVIIDECSQAIEAECWIALRLLASNGKLILAGDHRQLAPTILSISQTTRETLTRTLFERMAIAYPSNTTLLKIQYRMNLSIMQFPSQEFYNSRLICAPGVDSRLLSNMEGVAETDDTNFSLIFIDTAHYGFDESGGDGQSQADGGDVSRYNEGEVVIVVRHVNALCNAGVAAHMVTVISPYAAQVKKIREALDKLAGLEEVGVFTVDGVQGRENEAVILTMVRSNDFGRVGFVSDERRLNVAITRAKRQLCVVGDSRTLSRNEWLGKLIQYLEDNAQVRYPDLI